MSSLSDHQSDWKSRVFPGYVHTPIVCLSGGVGHRGGAPAPLPACPGTSHTDIAAYGQSGECAISLCSRSPDSFPFPGPDDRFVRAAMVGVSSFGGGIFSTAIDGSVASSVCGAGRWASSNSSAVVLIWRQVVKRTRVVQWTRCRCRRLVSTWICCHHRRRMIQRIWRNVGSPVYNKPSSPKSIGGATAEVP